MFYLIDKPAHITSFDVIRKLRKLIGVKKMGHIGTLDPFATGVTVVASGKSTKLIPLLEGAKKEYIFEVRLDGKSDSLDIDTPVELIQTDSYIDHSIEEVEGFLLSQKTQTPPKYSALRIDGKRAYDKARGGEEFEVAPRDITVYEAQVLAKSREKIQIRMIISSGGYIRSFAPLLGRFFGINGGYVSSLRRTSIYTDFGDINIDQCEKLGDTPPGGSTYSMIFHTIPTIALPSSCISEIKNGKSLSVNVLEGFELKSSNIFLQNNDASYVSLCERKGDILSILRNDVGDI